jgi:hypothetical protein
VAPSSRITQATKASLRDFFQSLYSGKSPAELPPPVAARADPRVKDLQQASYNLSDNQIKSNHYTVLVLQVQKLIKNGNSNIQTCIMETAEAGNQSNHPPHRHTGQSS